MNEEKLSREELDVETFDEVEDEKIQETGLVVSKEELIVSVEYGEYGLIEPRENSVTIIADGKKYELLPLEDLGVSFVSKFLDEGSEILDDEYVYRVNPENSQLMLHEGFQMPESLDNLDVNELELLILNHINSLVPYAEKKLTKETTPRPLLKASYSNFIIAGLAAFTAFFTYFTGIFQWHIFPLAAIYGGVYLYNGILEQYFIKTRNFKMFSGVITNIHTSLEWWPSLRRTHIQISNGKKFLTFPYNLPKKHKFTIGTPVTIFFPNSATIKEGDLGPTVDLILGISLSVDMKSADISGEYQDGKMQDMSTREFFDS